MDIFSSLLNVQCVAVYSQHFVASRINAPAAVVAAVFTLDHIVTTQTTMGWTKSLLYRRNVRLFSGGGPEPASCGMSAKHVNDDAK